MPITAKISFRILWRLALIAIICLGGCLYCLYDGAVTYPKDHDRAVIYQQLKDEGLSGNDLGCRWKEIADEHGWSERRPKNNIDIAFQFGMAACLVVPGLLYLFLFFRSWKRWIECTDVGLRTSWGQEFAFDQITALDKKKWKTKGIAIIRYQDGNRQRRLALDDWKYDTPTTKAILCEVESKIDPQKVTGGAPEPPAPTNPAA